MTTPDVLASCDPGSKSIGLVVGPIADTIPVDIADVAPAVAKIEALLVAHGATRLLIEWSSFHTSKNKFADTAKEREYGKTRNVVLAIAAMCRRRGIRVASDAEIWKPPGLKAAYRTGLVARSTWCRWIEAKSPPDPVTGRPRGIRDPEVKAALERLLSGYPAVLAKLRNAHERDAAGLLLGWGRAREELAAQEVAEAKALAERAAKAAERAGQGRKRNRGWEQTHREYARQQSTAWRRAHGIGPRVHLEDRIAAVLADGPRSYTEIAHALGQRPDSFHVNFARAVEASSRFVRVEVPRKPGQRGRPAPAYALATSPE